MNRDKWTAEGLQVGEELFDGSATPRVVQTIGKQFFNLTPQYEHNPPTRMRLVDGVKSGPGPGYPPRYSVARMTPALREHMVHLGLAQQVRDATYHLDRLCRDGFGGRSSPLLKVPAADLATLRDALQLALKHVKGEGA